MGSGGVLILRASEGRKAGASSLVNSTVRYLCESEPVYIASGSGVANGGLPIIRSRTELEFEYSILCRRRLRAPAMERSVAVDTVLGAKEG